LASWRSSYGDRQYSTAQRAIDVVIGEDRCERLVKATAVPAHPGRSRRALERIGLRSALVAAALFVLAARLPGPDAAAAVSDTASATALVVAAAKPTLRHATTPPHEPIRRHGGTDDVG
jgi:hypothetical protein